MADAGLQAQLKGLGHASPLFRRQAAFGVFALLQAHPGVHKDAVQDAVLACLCSRHMDVVEEGVVQLLATAAKRAAGLAPESALHLLLLALTTAGGEQRRRGTAAAGARLPAGSQHPLCSALLSHPGAAGAVLTAATDWLAAELGRAAPSEVAAAAADGPCCGVGGSGGLAGAWAVVRPFFSYVLSDAAGGDSGVGRCTAGACLSQLLCLSSCDPAAAQLLLPFLLRQMLLWRADSAASRLAAAQALSDVLDVLAAHSEGDDGGSPPSWWLPACADAGSLLLLLACRCVSPAAAGGVGCGGLGLLAPLLWRLGGALAPGLWRGELLQLGWLLLSCSSQQEQALLTRLIRAQLQHGSGAGARAEQAAAPWACAALQLPLLQQLVFGTSGAAKAWAAAALAQLQQQPTPPAPVAPPPPSAVAGEQGPLAALAAVQQLLGAWWAEPAQSLAWLAGLACSLDALEQAGPGAGGAGAGGVTALTVPLPAASAVRGLEAAGGGDDTAAVLASVGGLAWFSSHGLSPALQLLLAAALAHPRDDVAEAAAGIAARLALALPQLGPGLLPLALAQLRRAAADAGGAGGAGAPRRACALLGLLPCMCRESATASLVWRMLGPLLAVRAPRAHLRTDPAASTGLARAVAVALAAGAWQRTGRGWGRAEAAINGCMPPPGSLGGAGPPAAAEPPELKLLRAAAAEGVVFASSGRGLELLGCLQACLQDADAAPAAAAAALGALDALLERDELDFYKAWPLVARLLPPSRLLPAVGASGEPGVAAARTAARGAGAHSAAGLLTSRWVSLLRHGALDAALAPEVAAGLLSLLRMAAGAREAQVRGAAYDGLAAWPLSLLAELELPAAAGDYTAPLAVEAGALAAALVQPAPLTGATEQAGPGVDGAARRRLALAAHRRAMAGAEELAGAALCHEHASRRQFLAAAAGARGGAGGGGGGGGGGASAAATEREEAALRHRLARVLPQALTAAARGGREPAALAADGASPGALLLLWQPPGGERGAAPAAAFEGTFADVSARWGGGAAGGALCVAQPGLAAAAWECFMRRWLAAAGRVPDPLLARLRACWAGGLPAPAAAGLAGAAGLAAAGVLGEAQLEDLSAELVALVAGRSRSSAVAAAAAASLARLLPALHPGDWRAKERVVAALAGALLDAPGAAGDTGALAAAAAEGLAAAGCALLAHAHDEALFAAGGGGGLAADRSIALGASCLGLLLSCLAAAWRGGGGEDVRACVQRVVGQLPEELAQLAARHDLALTEDQLCCAELACAALRGSCCLMAALAARTAAAAGASSSPAAAAVAAAARAASATLAGHVLQQLQDVAALACSGGGSSSAGSGASAAETARHAAIVAAAPAAAAAALAASTLDATQLAAAAAAAARLARAAAAPGEAGGAPGVDGRLGAAAALCWSTLAAMRLSTGSLQEQELPALVAWLAAAAAPEAGAQQPAAKAPGATALRGGAAAGLALLLGAELAAGSCGEWTAGLMAAAGGGGSSWGLLGPAGSNTLQRLQLARGCVKALEAAAGLGGGGAATGATAAATAGWLLAAVCQAGRAGHGGGHAGAPVAPRGGGAGSAALPPLALYPAAGALRPLAERALAFDPSAALHAGSAGVAAALEVAACVRCLAAAPRLPAADWGGLCRRLISAAAAAGARVGGGGGADSGLAAAAAAAAQQLQAAALGLLLAHCHAAALDLAGVLDACLSPAGFRQLAPLQQGALLAALGPALAALPVNRAAAVLQGLPGLVGGLTGEGGGPAPAPGSGALLLVLSAWRGLAEVCQAAADQRPPMVAAHRQLLSALHACVAGLASQLPALRPGEASPGQLLALRAAQPEQAAAALERAAEAHQHQLWGPLDGGGGGGGGGSDAASASLGLLAPAGEPPAAAVGGAALQVWGAALGCLRLLHPDLLLGLTAPPGGAGASGGGGGRSELPTLVGALQLRSMLVLLGKLSWKSLAEARHALLGMPSALGGPAGPAQQVLLPLALAAATAPQAGVLQQLQEAAAAAGLAASPDNAAALAAATLAAWLTAGSGGAAPGEDAPDGSTAAAAATAVAACAEAQLALAHAALALEQLPALLPQLLSSPRLLGSRPAFAEAVSRALLDVAAQPRLSARAAARLRAAVAAVRELLPAAGSCWPELLLAAA
ncbi:hypothetical protein HT031_005820 [Scenedesmus sp. PABB004]|nr:hypothetical protein HT031_005820 [Scenedesmus sp. PABB004]